MEDADRSFSVDSEWVTCIGTPPKLKPECGTKIPRCGEPAFLTLDMI